jgi:predicted O-linked N-acetylglucosamine transferase (SPINDLY family)
LAYRPAPIQVNYLGYPGTMGANFMDYIIVDPFVVPADQQPFFTEKLVHLPDCYQPNDRKRVIAERTPTRTECGLPEEGFVFACFNNTYKITPVFFDIWMRLLRGTPGSVLWLLQDNHWSADNLRREANARGVAPERLVFAPRCPLPEHLARHRLGDLFLDTLPYNAHTTTSDALWVGLPVLTCAGRSFAARVAGSLLQAVGLPELITHDLADYEALALRLATTPELLRDIRSRLERNRPTAPLFDTDRYCRHLEAAYREMWGLWQRGEPPRPIALPASGLSLAGWRETVAHEPRTL